MSCNGTDSVRSGTYMATGTLSCAFVLLKRSTTRPASRPLVHHRVRTAVSSTNPGRHNSLEVHELLRTYWNSGWERHWSAACESPPRPGRSASPAVGRGTAFHVGTACCAYWYGMLCVLVRYPAPVLCPLPSKHARNTRLSGP